MYHHHNQPVITLIIMLVFLTAYFVDDIKCHFGASMISGLVTTLVSMPVDIAKTRYVVFCANSEALQ